MKISPLDIEKMKFKVCFRGYQRREVDEFLDSLTVEYEGLINENENLREKQVVIEGQLKELKNKESILTQTLTNAQKLVEEMKEGAQKDASLIVKQAEFQAEEVLRDSRDESVHIRSEILDLRKQRMFFIERCRSTIDSFQKLLEIEVQEQSLETENS